MRGGKHVCAARRNIPERHGLLAARNPRGRFAQRPVPAHADHRVVPAAEMLGKRRGIALRLGHHHGYEIPRVHEDAHDLRHEPERLLPSRHGVDDEHHFFIEFRFRQRVHSIYLIDKRWNRSTTLQQDGS
ncbi:hypothetical protein SDC9_110116 [bioreactor metagenome]|uniref:Uncharacterized protein n=1 Tax=bioreactor metagenome TaxID=1076179 RepID=A0A645BDQ8_9ZZZZ